MAYFIKRSGGWQAQIRRKGIVENRTFRTKAQAVAWADQREAEIKDGKPPASTLTVQAVLLRYAAEVSPNKRGARWELLRLALLGDLLADKPLAELTADDLGKWRDARLAGGERRAVGPATVNREMNLISAVLEHARTEWGMLKTNVASEVKRPSNPAHRTRLISDAERDRLLMALGYEDSLPVSTLSQQVAVALLLALETGMRAGEIIGLTWPNVAARHVMLPMTKNGTAREVPLSKRAVELLGKMRELDAARVFTVSAGSRDALFRKARDRCQLDVTFHDARHSAVTRLARLVDVMTLARIIGHRDLKSLMTYYNPSADSIADRLG